MLTATWLLQLQPDKLNLRSALQECALKVCLYVASPTRPSSKFIIVPMVTVPLMDRMGPLSILSLKGPVTADTMLNFDGDYHGHGHNDATCEQTLRSNTSSCMTFAGQTYFIENNNVSHMWWHFAEERILKYVISLLSLLFKTHYRNMRITRIAVCVSETKGHIENLW